MSKRPLARLALPVVAPLLALALVSCGDRTEPDDSGSSAESTESESGEEGAACTYVADGSPAAKEAELPSDRAAYSGQVGATLTTSAGDIQVTLDAEAAPCTVNSFASLAEQGYFDDTECHRLTGGGGLSVLQCGDPSATGSGGPGYSFDDELTGDETYPAGTLAMANAGPDTNGSQFFMVYAESQLQPDYTVFGSIDPDGVAVLEEIAAEGSDNANGPGDGRPLTEVQISEVSVD